MAEIEKDETRKILSTRTRKVTFPEEFGSPEKDKPHVVAIPISREESRRRRDEAIKEARKEADLEKERNEIQAYYEQQAIERYEKEKPFKPFGTWKWSFDKLENQMLDEEARGKVRNYELKQRIFRDYIENLEKHEVPLTHQEQGFKDQYDVSHATEAIDREARVTAAKADPKKTAQQFYQNQAIEKYKKSKGFNLFGSSEWTFEKLEAEMLQKGKDVLTAVDERKKLRNTSLKQEIYKDYLRKLQKNGQKITKEQDNFLIFYEGPSLSEQLVRVTEKKSTQSVKPEATPSQRKATRGTGRA